jgi:hypothetical protein
MAAEVRFNKLLTEVVLNQSRISRYYFYHHISYIAVANVLITQLVFGEDLMEALEEAKAVSTQFF